MEKHQADKWKKHQADKWKNIRRITENTSMGFGFAQTSKSGLRVQMRNVQQLTIETNMPCFIIENMKTVYVETQN